MVYEGRQIALKNLFSGLALLQSCAGTNSAETHWVLYTSHTMITVLIITKNAANTVRKTLESVVGWENKVVVIDDYSTDTTQEIARNFGCTVITHAMENFGAQRAFALTQVDTEWTLVLDSDEVLTEEMKSEITFAIQNKEFDGYYLKLRNHLFEKKLLHGELHKKLILFKTKNASILPIELHESYMVQGRIGTLSSEINHYSYRTILQVMRKFFSYSILQAKEYKRKKIQYGIREFFLHPVHMFYSRYIQNEGYKDGFARIFLDDQFAHMEFFSYFLIPFVKTKKRVSVDCGSYSVGGMVQSGIERLLQGIYTSKSSELEYYWFHFSGSSVHKLPQRFFSQIWLPLKTIWNRCDVFLGTGGTIPAILSFFPIKKTLFLYDFGFFSSPEKYNVSAHKLQTQTESSIRRADIVVFLHEEPYREFIERYPKYCYKAHVIPAGADHLIIIKEQPVFIKPNKPLALFVGVVKPVKQIEKLISVVENTYCIIAGPQEKKYKDSLVIGESQSIQFIHNFNDGQLKWLYKNADVMLYTSKHEGFCYPVLEALSLGLPVVAFDLPLFREYKKYFNNLTLVSSEEEMKRELKSTHNYNHLTIRENPYTWDTFAQSLTALWQPTLLPKGAQKKIAFIFVLYKTPQEEVKRLEQEVENIGLSAYEIYWIDNSTNAQGYAAGINEGVRKGLIDKCDVFIALNPDTSLKGVTVENILSAAKEFDVWGFGMRQNGKIYYGGEIDRWRLSGGLISSKPQQRFVSVDFISGSLVGLSKEVVQMIGLWNENYFMYYEDVDYCVRARKAGFQVGVDSDVVYDHFEVSQANIQKEKWIARSRWKFFWKYSNLLQKIRELIRLPKTIILNK